MLFFKRVVHPLKCTFNGVKPTCKKGYTLVYVGINRCVYAVNNNPNYGCAFAKVKTKHKRTVKLKITQAKRVAKKQHLHLVVSVI